MFRKQGALFVGKTSANKSLASSLLRSILAKALTILAALSVTPSAHPYSLLTHEQLIDLTWHDSILPMLRNRYPYASPAELEAARAYAYGGCAIQDVGYYPFGDVFISQLTHYVRTGDFIASLFRHARNPNELAFAIGALSHYIGDTIGHADATNRAVPVEFPRLAAVYGPVVTYAEDEHAHVQTEFAFDINEIARQRLAPARYLRHIGLGVPTGQLAAAFYETYGLGKDFANRRSRRINVRGYRFAVRSLLPRAAYAVTILHRKDLPADSQSADFLRLQKEAAAVATGNDWNRYRRKPGMLTYATAGLIYILPKVGPLRDVAVRGPTPETAEEYVRSVNRASDELRTALDKFGGPKPGLDNRDLDTGYVVREGGYKLTDETYAKLLHRLAADPRVAIPSELKADILSFYANPDTPTIVKGEAAKWSRVQTDLSTLAAMPVIEAPEAKIANVSK